jgi:hypothetical protein
VALEHGDLVAQAEDLGVLSLVGAGERDEHAPCHLPAVTTTIRNACHASSPADSPMGWHLDAVHYPASADPEPVAAVAPGEADVHRSGHDVSAS